MAREHIKDSVLHAHAKNYIRAVMADRLLQEGFVCRDSRDLHWYRLVNGNVLQAIYFYTQWSSFPIALGIAYACHPLYITPQYPKRLRCTVRLISSGIDPTFESFDRGRYILSPDETNVYFSDDAIVWCPKTPGAGLEILEDILSRFIHIKTPEECYRLHLHHYEVAAQARNQPVETLYGSFSIDLMNEVFFYEDKELYPYCIDNIQSYLKCFQHTGTFRKHYPIEIRNQEESLLQERAFVGGYREEHLAHLQQLQEENLNILRRKVKGLGI